MTTVYKLVRIDEDDGDRWVDDTLRVSGGDVSQKNNIKTLDKFCSLKAPSGDPVQKYFLYDSWTKQIFSSISLWKKYPLKAKQSLFTEYTAIICTGSKIM